MCVLLRIITGIVLGIQSFWDLRTRELPTLVSALGGVAGLFLSVLSGRAWYEIFLSCIPGFACLVAYKLTKGAVGDGDAILLIAMGMGYTLEEISFICFASYALASVVALILIVFFQKKKKDEVPFVPFLLFGWGMEWLALYGGVG